MARRISWLFLVEAAALAAWLALAGAAVHEAQSTSGALLPIDPEALAVGASAEDWMGIYFQEQKVGYAVSARRPTVDGGALLQNRSAFRMAAFGEIKEIVTAGTAVVDAAGRVRQFDFFMSSPPVRLAARGEIRDTEVVIEVHQAGEVQTLTLDVDSPPQISLSLSEYIAAQVDGELTVGQTFEIPYFDPASLAQDTMQMEVVDVEIMPNAEEAYWIKRRFGDLETRVLMTPSGTILREEGALGMSLVRQTPEEAQSMPDEIEPVDIISLSAVKLKGRLANARSLRRLEMRILDVEPERVFHAPPLQSVEGDRVTVDVPLLDELPTLPVSEVDPAFAEALAGTPFMPVDHKEIQATSRKVLGDYDDRKAASEALVNWVYKYLAKAPTVGVPNALEVLQIQQGDCNEHTSLYVALARAAGIPARIAAGVVWSDRVGDRGAFYYHAWPEVYLGGPTGWVPVDPTFGQFPADATHVKLVEGDLDRQIEIMGVMGRLGFELIDSM